jgi:hypothetical protein
MPPGSDDVPIASAEMILNEIVREAIRCVGAVASVTVMVTLLIPLAPGVPEIVPELASMDRPAGNPVADQA